MHSGRAAECSQLAVQLDDTIVPPGRTHGRADGRVDTWSVGIAARRADEPMVGGQGTCAKRVELLEATAAKCARIWKLICRYFKEGIADDTLL